MGSVNHYALPLVQHMIEEADALEVAVSRLDNGTTVIDAGIHCRGSL